MVVHSHTIQEFFVVQTNMFSTQPTGNGNHSTTTSAADNLLVPQKRRGWVAEGVAGIMT